MKRPLFNDKQIFEEAIRQASIFLDYAHTRKFNTSIDDLYDLEGYAQYSAISRGVGWRARLQHALFRRLFWRQMLVNQAIVDRMRLLHGSTNQQKPQLLFMVPHDATQASMGGSARNHEMARFLSRWFHVQLIVLTGPSKEPQVIPMGADFDILAFPKSSRVGRNSRRTGAAAEFVVFMESVRDTPYLLPYLSVVAQKSAAVLLSSPFLFPAVEKVLGDIPIVYETMDVTTDYVKMVAADQDTESIHKIEEAERCLIARANMVIGVTERDIEAMKERFNIPSEKFLLVPNGVNCAMRFCSEPSMSRNIRKMIGMKAPIVLFVGSPMRANIEAAIFIRDKLAPSFPNVLFVIMGLHEHELGTSRGSRDSFINNMYYMGPIPDTSRRKEALFLLSDIAVAPMEYGTGSSLKIPDYLAHGKILISTEIGARGHETLHPWIRLTSRQGFIDTLTDVLVRLDANPAALDAQAIGARKVIMETLDWQVVCKPLADRMLEVVAR